MLVLNIWIKYYYYYPLKKLYNSVDIFNNVLCIPCNIDVSIEHMDKILLLLS